MFLERFRLDGQVALVTGGTRGLGLAIAEALAEAGARLVLSSRTPNDSALDEVRALGATVDYVQADLLEDGAGRRLVEDAVRVAGRLDVLVNNAGIPQRGVGPGFAPEKYRALMSTNLDSLFQACEAAYPVMKRQGGGVILNIGSISGIISNVPQQQPAYNASKAAVHMLSKSLASDWALDNIRVNVLAPGYIATEMSIEALNDPVTGPIWKEMTPMQRPATPEEIASAALFLCSPASSYITGAVLVADGGYTAR